jgi:hypothetical protein
MSVIVSFYTFDRKISIRLGQIIFFTARDLIKICVYYKTLSEVKKGSPISTSFNSLTFFSILSGKRDPLKLPHRGLKDINSFSTRIFNYPVPYEGIGVKLSKTLSYPSPYRGRD